MENSNSTIPSKTDKKPEKPASISPIKLNGPKQCPTKAVTVFGDRAEITRSVSFTAADAGEHSIVVDGLSNFIDEASIHVSGGVGEATILEVSYRKRIEPLQRDESEASIVRQKIQDVDEEIQAEERNLARAQKEATWLSNWSAQVSGSGANKADDQKLEFANLLSDSNLEQTEKFLDFYERMMLKNDTKTASITKQIKSLQEKKQNIMNSFRHQVTPSQEKREVILGVHVDKPGLIELNLSYIVHRASWVANYDVRVSSETGTSLVYYGTISNNTNEEWTNASLSLSTASPASGGSPPELSTLRVEFQEQTYAGSGRGGSRSSSAAAANPLYSQSIPSGANPLYSTQAQQHSVPTNATWSMQAQQQSAFAIDEEVNQKSKPVSVLTTSSSEGVSSASFTIPRPADIPADGEPHKVTIAIVSLTSRFTNVVVPKKTEFSYLKATITNTSQLPFLEGDANVFMDMNFVARSRLQYVPAGDNFAIYLGVDNFVRVDRKPDKKQNDTASYILSKSNVRTMRHESVVKNSKNAPVALVLYEQLPLSVDEKIKVKLVSPQLTATAPVVAAEGGGDASKTAAKAAAAKPTTKIHINHDNILEWRSILPAKAEASFVVEYTLEWPKDKTVQIN